MKSKRQLITNQICYVLSFVLIAALLLSTIEIISEAKTKERRYIETIEVLEKRLAIYEDDYVVPNPAPPRYYDVPLEKELQDFIWSMCCEYEITEHYSLVYAVIETESNFVPNVVSISNDYGLMQINVVNHSYLSDKLGTTDFLDPYQNVQCGVYLLSNLLHKYDVSDALMSYNMGVGGASKLWSRGIHTSTYTDKVLSKYSKYNML